jgi:23S rRNA (guanine745-N1)-methyltransferase
MTLDPITSLRCPLDDLPLSRQTSSVICARGHCYDLAREGYLNLLLAQYKSSKNPGDSKAMVTSRRNFLNAGYYDPIANGINQAVLKALADGKPPGDRPRLMMDVACGEGFYLSQVRSCLQATQPPTLYFGLDISKFAIKAATRRDRNITWVVGSSAHLPVADGQLDGLLCTFFNVEFAVLCPKLKPDGHLIIVVPNQNHLIELRALIYETVQYKTLDYADKAAGLMTLKSQTDLSFPIRITEPEMVQNLFAMTPHYWRTTPGGRSRLAAQTELTLTVDVSILTFAPIV